MKVFITGASGYLGNKLAMRLAEEGQEVHALLRSLSKAGRLAHPGIHIHEGDITDPSRLRAAMEGCRQVYHVAGDVRMQGSDDMEVLRNNFSGSRNVFEAALQTGVEKLVFTSSGTVMGYSVAAPLTEDTPRINGYDSDYDLSKRMAEEAAVSYFRKGLPVVVVRPTKIFGPGCYNADFSLMRWIRYYWKHHIVAIPGPRDYAVNFCYIDDVVDGHIRSMQCGRPGEAYILGGYNYSYRGFFRQLDRLLHRKGLIVKVPAFVMKTGARLQQLRWLLGGHRISYTPGAVEVVYHNHLTSSQKAIRELGYRITPLEQALRTTLQYLQQQGI